eukprot:jgi/Tetstr1/459202/TSEL_004646.t1
MRAFLKACEHGDVVTSLRWLSGYAYMQHYRRTYMASRELSMFDQCFPRLDANRTDTFREGVTPHMHNHLHHQLMSPARVLLSHISSLDELPTSASRLWDPPPKFGFFMPYWSSGLAQRRASIFMLTWTATTACP